MKIKKDEIVEFLADYVGLDDVKDKMTKLKGFDWNPFDDDDDEYENAWEEICHNKELVWDAAVALAGVVERILVDGIGELNDQEKHKAVVSALDRAIDLPFYLEPFDGIALDMMVTGAVRAMNVIRKINPDSEEKPIVITPVDGGFKEIG